MFADSPPTLRTLMAALMQHPEVRAAMDRVFEDAILYGNVRPETEEAVLRAVAQATKTPIPGVDVSGILEFPAVSPQGGGRVQ